MFRVFFVEPTDGDPPTLANAGDRAWNSQEPPDPAAKERQPHASAKRCQLPPSVGGRLVYGYFVAESADSARFVFCLSICPVRGCRWRLRCRSSVSNCDLSFANRVLKRRCVDLAMENAAFRSSSGKAYRLCHSSDRSASDLQPWYGILVSSLHADCSTATCPFQIGVIGAALFLQDSLAVPAC